MCWIAPPVSLECVLEDPVAVPSCPAINWPVPNPTPPPEVPDYGQKNLKNYTIHAQQCVCTFTLRLEK